MLHIPEKGIKMKILLKRLFVALVISVYLFSSTSCNQPQRYEAEFEVMGTYLAVTIDGETQSDAAAASRAVNDEMQRINSLMSTWQADTPLSILNRMASEGWTEADGEIISVLQEAMQYSRLTDGGFDVTAGPLIRLWGFLKRSEQRPPTDEEIQDAMAKIGWQNVEIDNERSMIRFTVPGMEVDFGAIAKGYAVDRALGILRESDIETALVSLGGNVGVIGLPAGRESWGVAVRDPRHADALLGTLSLDTNFDGWGVASSGQYERFFEYEGRRYGHIIDPRTGYPVEGVLGTTVVAASAMQADALSTCLFVVGEERGISLLTDEPGAFGMIMLSDGEGSMRIRISKELVEYFTLFEGVEGVKVEEF